MSSCSTLQDRQINCQHVDKNRLHVHSAGQERCIAVVRWAAKIPHGSRYENSGACPREAGPTLKTGHSQH